MAKKIALIGFMLIFSFSLFAMEKEETQFSKDINYLIFIPPEMLAYIAQSIDYRSYIKLAQTNTEMMRILFNDEFRHQYEHNRAINFSPLIKKLHKEMLDHRREKEYQSPALNALRKKLPEIIEVMEMDVNLVYGRFNDDMFKHIKPMIESAVSMKDDRTVQYLVAAIRLSSQAATAQALIAEWEKDKSPIIIAMLISFMRAGAGASFYGQYANLANVAEWAIAKKQEEVLRAVIQGHIDSNIVHELSQNRLYSTPIGFAMYRFDGDKALNILIADLPACYLVTWLSSIPEYAILNNPQVAKILWSDKTLQKLKTIHESLKNEYEKALAEGDTSQPWKGITSETAQGLLERFGRYRANDQDS